MYPKQDRTPHDVEATNVESGHVSGQSDEVKVNGIRKTSMEYWVAKAEDVKDFIIGPNRSHFSTDASGEPHEDSNAYTSPNEKLWSMYNEEAAAYDKSLVEYLAGDMNALVTFAGLFSAAVTAFIIESYKALDQDSGDVTNLYLRRISLQLAAMTNASVTSLPPLDPPPFAPSHSAVLVNRLWVSSLVISLACALGALLVQSWTRRYTDLVTSAKGGADARAHVHAFLREGIARCGLGPLTVGLPAFMHVALFLFFAGLIEFFLPINAQVAHVTAGLVAVWAAAYLVFTLIVFKIHNAPFITPVTPVIRLILVFPIFAGVSIMRILISTLNAVPRMLHMDKFTNMTETEWLRISATLGRYRRFIDGDVFDKNHFTPERRYRAIRWLMKHIVHYDGFCRLFDILANLATTVDASQQTMTFDAIFCLSNYSHIFGHGIGSHIAHLLHYSADLEETSRKEQYVLSSTSLVCVLAMHSNRVERLKHADTRPRSTVWLELCQSRLLGALGKLGKDHNPAVALAARSTGIMLVCRTIQDLFHRVSSQDVTVFAPPDWTFWQVIAALGMDRQESDATVNLVEELAEFSVIFQLLPQPNKEDLDSISKAHITYGNPNRRLVVELKL